mgnify:CR=1 FL=1
MTLKLIKRRLHFSRVAVEGCAEPFVDLVHRLALALQAFGDLAQSGQNRLDGLRLGPQGRLSGVQRGFCRPGAGRRRLRQTPGRRLDRLVRRLDPARRLGHGPGRAGELARRLPEAFGRCTRGRAAALCACRRLAQTGARRLRRLCGLGQPCRERLEGREEPVARPRKQRFRLGADGRLGPPPGSADLRLEPADRFGQRLRRSLERARTGPGAGFERR